MWNTHNDLLAVGVSELGGEVHQVQRQECDAASVIITGHRKSADHHVLVTYSLHLSRDNSSTSFYVVNVPKT